MIETEKVVRSCCQGCHCECGVLVHVKDGKVVKIEGDPEHPANEGVLCPKGRAYKELLYHPDRLKYPLIRAGERGQGKWQRISWDEALGTIATRFKEIREKYGPLALAYTISDSPRGGLAPNMDLLYSLGSPSVIGAAHVCFTPAVIAGSLTVGGSIAGEVGSDCRNSKCMLIWGANPIATHPTVGRNIIRSKAKGAKLIVVDPRFTTLASKADLWLQVRPATDDALALGMLNVVINEGLYDKEFVDKWCVGFDKLRERVQEYPVGRVANITWVPKEKIVQAARACATIKPATLQFRTAVEQHTNTVQTLRAILSLMAICGNIDVKGGNVFPVFPPGFHRHRELRSAGVARLPKEVLENQLGAKEFPLFSGPRALSPRCHKPTALKAMISGKPNAIKGIWGVANWLVSSESAKEAVEALKTLDFLVLYDFFMTPTTEYADMVLPATTWLERDEICDVSYPNYIVARQKAVEPLYECRDEREIAFEIRKRMGLKSIALPVSTIEEFNDFRLQPMGITFEDLKKKRIIVEPMRYKKYEQEGFATPSGKVELYSSVLEQLGYDPLPYYAENPESPVSSPELFKDYPLILIAGAKHIAFYHGANRQIPALRKLRPFPLIEINPETADNLGIKDGDWVWIETPKGKGRVRQRAKITSGIHPKVVCADSHWWFPEKPEPEHGCWESNINMLMPSGPPYDPIAGCVALKGALCKVYKAEGVQSHD